jgi:uroporphyrin-III C-methyltransferase
MTVYQIGVGPGGAGMLTCRAEALLARADVVVHDRGLGDDVLGLVSPTARLVAVDSTSDSTADSTDGSTADGLSRWRRTDACVVRLFDSSTDVAPEARRHDVAVPSVTTALAVPALAGIPVMDRQRAACVTVADGADPATDWPALAHTGGTLVVVGARGRIDTIVAGLVRGGLDPATPVAAVSTTTASPATDSRTVDAPTNGARIGTLDTVADRDDPAAAILVIGPVVALAGATPSTVTPVGTDSVPILRRPVPLPGPAFPPTPGRARD